MAGVNILLLHQLVDRVSGGSNVGFVASRRVYKAWIVPVDYDATTTPTEEPVIETESDPSSCSESSFPVHYSIFLPRTII